jgi:peptidoglycan-N-acetylglucosamine deacetylase
MWEEFLDSIERVPPGVLKKILKDCIWRGDDKSGVLALTFDDGPDPEVTPFVLDVLDEAGGR